MESSLTKGLRDEHQALISEFAALPASAAAVGAWESGTLDRIRRVVDVLRHQLLPHADAEERVLYPAFERVLQLPGSTAAFVADHEEIRRRVDFLAGSVAELGDNKPTPAQQLSLQEHLWGLWAILRLHLDKEEKEIFPRLGQRLSTPEAVALMREMGAPVPFPEGLDQLEARLYEHMTHHLDNERFVLGAYVHLAETSRESYVGYLMNLVIDDERHHHRLFEELLNTLRARVGGEAGAVVPEIVPLGDTPGLLEATERYLEFERSDRRELEQLEKELRHLRDISIWPLLVELMRRDTEKHVRILEFIRDRAPRAVFPTARRTGS